MKCTHCGFENRPGIKFCEECGQPLPQPVESQARQPDQQGIADAVRCPACGHINHADMRFCEECGNLLQETGTSRKQASTPGVRPKPFRLGRGWLAVGVVLALALVIVLAVTALSPELSRDEAVELSRERIQSLYPSAGNLEPDVQTNRVDGQVIYRIEYQTDSGKAIFIVNAETGETLILGTR